MTIPKLLTIGDVMAVTGLSRSTIFNQRVAGEFPPPVKLSSQRIAWREGDIAEWIAGRCGVE